MRNRETAPHKTHFKSTEFLAQQRLFYNFLQNNLCTASMLTASTGIPQKNVTRFKRHYEKLGMLWQVYEARCELTGFMAWYITTNEKLVPEFPKQLSLF